MTTSGGTRTSSSVWRWFSSVAAGVASWAYPPECIECGVLTSLGEPVCAACAGKLPKPLPHGCRRCGEALSDARVDLCLRCGTRVRAFDAALSLGLYQGPWGDLVRAFKFEGERAVGRWLAGQLGQRVADETWGGTIACVTHVPMTAREERGRGFNPSRILARGAARSLGLPERRLLAKARPTVPQRTLPASARETNLRHAFRAVRSGNGSVLLVDDLLTTGATAEECARTLKRAGFARVYVATVAHA
ncbi:MAG: ComF family protein [Candidatus Bipolaricaulota bacterium]